MKFTFKRGIHPAGNKHIAKDLAFSEFPTPAVVSIPLSQHIGAPASVCVAVGDEVKVGTLIGKAAGFVSANVYYVAIGCISPVLDSELIDGDASCCFGIQHNKLIGVLLYGNAARLLKRIKNNWVVDRNTICASRIGRKVKRKVSITVRNSIRIVGIKVYQLFGGSPYALDH